MSYLKFDEFRRVIAKPARLRVGKDASVRLGRKKFHSHELVRHAGRRVEVVLDRSGLGASAMVFRDGEYLTSAAHLPSEVRALRRLGGRCAFNARTVVQREMDLINAYKRHPSWK